MGHTKRLFEEVQFEEVLGEEFRAHVHWMEQETYARFPTRNTYEEYAYD